MQKDNTLKLKLRLFDTAHEVEIEIGKYENLLLADMNVDQLVREVKAAFTKLAKRLEIEANNLKKGQA